MNAVADLLGRLGRTVLRLTLGLAAAVFLLSLLLASLLAVLGLSLFSLLTGRKPAPVVLFARMRERSQRFAQGGWGQPAAAPRGEVVDVEAREIPDARGPSRQP
ncbi:hypothetical protein [Hydrogenophaga sp. T2]|uniref:hypothetical protein n=1 Tax=Hydrogenophaga sp. T2 TaxID=3132823 RepID=UPI003CFA7427